MVTFIHWKSFSHDYHSDWQKQSTPNNTKTTNNSSNRSTGGIVSIAYCCHGYHCHPTHIQVDCARITWRIYCWLSYSESKCKDEYTCSKDSEDEWKRGVFKYCSKGKYVAWSRSIEFRYSVGPRLHVLTFCEDHSHKHNIFIESNDGK